MIGAVALMGAACAADQPVTGPNQLTGAVVASNFDGPTQLAVGPDDTWFVAQLNGDENDATGQIIRVDPDAPDDRRVVVDGLDKPTGVAVFADRLWVMERRRLSRFALDGTDPVVMVDDMAFNGRSQGALTVDGDRLLFNTSGRIGQHGDAPADPQTSSGVLWSVDRDGVVEPVAAGFKHAYHQVRDDDGVLWSTELADGTYDGLPAIDELVAVVEGVDHGWPRCVGDNRAVAEFDGSDEVCADVPASHAVFTAGATPTSVAASPWDPEELLVALWVTGDVVAVSTDAASAPASSTVVYSDAARPQHLVADGDRVLLVDHETGQILALQPR